MKKLIYLTTVTLILFSFTSCATIGGTMAKPPLYVDFEYPIEDVWFETFRVLTSQGLVFEKGTFEEGFFVFRRWSTSGFPIPIIGVYAVFKEFNNKTKVEFHYNQDGVIPFYKLENKVKHLIIAINTNLMIRCNKTRPYKIYNFKKWLDHYKYN